MPKYDCITVKNGKIIPIVNIRATIPIKTFSNTKGIRTKVRDAIASFGGFELLNAIGILLPQYGEVLENAAKKSGAIFNNKVIRGVEFMLQEK